MPSDGAGHPSCEEEQNDDVVEEDNEVRDGAENPSCEAEDSTGGIIEEEQSNDVDVEEDIDLVRFVLNRTYFLIWITGRPVLFVWKSL